MGLLKGVTHRVLQSVADRVARNDLFEKPGERAWQAPLRPRKARAGTAAEVAALEGPVVVHHWATWCEPCEKELPLVEQLAQALDGKATVVGVSWDRFQDQGDMEQTLARVEAMAASVSWDTIVLTDTPAATFSTLKLAVETVPQTFLLNAEGQVLEHVPGPLDAEHVTSLKSRL